MDMDKTKKLRSAQDDESLIHVFKPSIGSNWTIGILQLDVLVSRVPLDYKIQIEFDPIPYSSAR